MTVQTGPTGVIHDLGYQRYTGSRLGRRYVAGTLYTLSLRTAYGLGRGFKAKIFPWLTGGLILSVAVVVAAVRAWVGEVVLGYLDFTEAVFPFVVLFAAVAAPELVSRDLRNRVLPLYFSRPLRPDDYALAKLAALVSALWLLLAVPLLLMYVVAVFSMDGLGGVWDETGDAAAGLAYTGIAAAVVGVLALLVASLVSRRAVAAGAVVAVFLVTLPVVELIRQLGTAGSTASVLVGLAAPSTLIGGLRKWLFEGGDMIWAWYAAGVVALLVVGAGLLAARYRRLAR
jgi:ABC-2 type transport system permease protein